MLKIHTGNNPASRIDHADMAAIERRLMEASDKLTELVPRIAVARQVREHDSDRRKAALAKAMIPHLEGGDSATAADAKGRASFTYVEAMKGLAQQLQSAEATIAEWDATKTAWESARSLLSVAKELTKL